MFKKLLHKFVYHRCWMALLGVGKGGHCGNCPNCPGCKK